jgi:segregation and condensation protein B
MEINDLKKHIESLLFISGEPMSLKNLMKVLEVGEEEIKNAIESLKSDFSSQNRGLTIVENLDNYQLTTSPASSEIISKYLKETLKEDLTPASLETLAIISYKGPMTRPEIDNIRGVNSSFIIRNLLIRGLIERDLDVKKANAYVYKISFDLLRKLGLEKIEQLPGFQEYNSL